MNTQRDALLDLSSTPFLETNGVVTLSALRSPDGELMDLCLTSLRVQTGSNWQEVHTYAPGQKLSELLKPYNLTDELTLLTDRCAEVIQTHQPASLRHRFQRSGKTFLFDLSIIPLGDGVLITYTNNSPVDTSPTQPSAVDALLLKLLDTASCGLLYSRALRNQQGRIVDFQVEQCNEAICQMTGIPRQQMLTQTMLTCDPRGLDSGILDRWAEVVETGIPQAFDHYFVGQGRWLQQKLTPYDGGILASFVDVSEARLNSWAELLEQAFDNVYTGIVVYQAVRDQSTDPQPGRIVDFYIRHVNQTAARMRGLPADQITGRLASELFPEQKTKGLFEQFVDVCQTGRPIRTEKHYADFGVWVDITITRQGDGVVVTFTDVSAQKEAELASQKQASLLQAIVDRTEAGITLLEPVYDASGTLMDFRMVLVNQYAARTYGWSPQELTDGRPVGHFMAGWQQTERFNVHKQVLETGEVHSTVLYQDNYGIRGWFEITLSRFDNRLLHTLVDITAVRQAEERQREQSRLHQTVIDNIQAGVVLLDAVRDPDTTGQPGAIVDFRYRLTNEVNARQGGKTVDELSGRLVGDIFPGWQQTELFPRMVQVLETGEPQNNVGPYTHYGWNGWFDGSYNKIGDSLLYTYVDVTRLKESELNARRKQELLDSILNVSPTAILACEAIHDPVDGRLIDYRYVAANSVAARLSGRSQDEIIGQTVTALFPSSEETEFLTYWQRAYETGEPQRFETFYAAEGVQGWYDMTVVRWGTGLVIVGSNVTETRKAQEEKKYQADTFQAMLASMLHGMSIFQVIRDEHGKLVDLVYEYVSEQILRDTGLTRNELVGQRILTLFPGVRQSQFWPAYEAMQEVNEPQQFEDHYNHDGIDNYVMGQVVWIDADRLVMTYQILNDLKRAQKQTEEQAKLLRSVLDGSQNGIIAFDAVRNEEGTIVDFRYVLQNEANRQRVGRTDQQLIGHTMREFFPDVAENGLLNQYAQVVDTGRPFRQDLEYDYGRGLGWYNISVVKRGDGMVLTVMDKTAEKRAEESMRSSQRQLEAANEELSQSNENLQSFAYVASHDLQEPLRKIQSFGDLLIEQYAPLLPAEGADLIRRMQTASARMSDLIRDILAYSRITTHGLPFVPVQLDTVLREIQADLSQRIVQTGALIDIGSLPTVQGDRSQLWQLFSNLLSNALKFIQPGQVPQITVRAQHLTNDEAPDALRNRQEGSWWAISVQDNGIGFDEKYLERIFQVFQRLHGKKQYPGSGIGLAICKRVAERHGGMLTATSKPGQGATFKVYLPVAISE
ncbi:PAS domain-containing protein [Fibrisoma montanum]|uniref:histidine kinase n=1 Tax=Fibrisoma montanum TaxID=2305895 RepID=A0A418M048_9BACT|nr:PAS domain-containing protein [Fibrisoma montanum]RIV19052.1 PAS domain-containing protein [Fibrisoma montanum]